MIGAALAFARPSLPLLAGSAALTVLTVALGHSVGLHRGMIHRTYRTSPAVRRVLLLLFAQTGLGGPIAWMRLHRVRDYWQNEAACPPYFAYRHALALDFWWNLHCRFEPRDPERYGFPLDAESDRFVAFLQRTWMLHPLALAALIAATLGIEAAATLVCARAAVIILGHWFIGFVSHTHGVRRFAIDGAVEEGRNQLVLGWLSFGEGFHNNHHAHPGSARMGLEWCELDLGWWLLVALGKLGLAHDIQAFGRTPSTARPGIHELRAT